MSATRTALLIFGIILTFVGFLLFNLCILNNVRVNFFAVIFPFFGGLFILTSLIKSAEEKILKKIEEKFPSAEPVEKKSSCES
jgi:hypothetical protein